MVDVLRAQHLLGRHVERRAEQPPVVVSARFSGAVASFIRAMPKSSTLTTSSPASRFARKRFAGLMSRWTTPASCARDEPETRLRDDAQRDVLARAGRCARGGAGDLRPAGTPSRGTGASSRHRCRRRARARCAACRSRRSRAPRAGSARRAAASCSQIVAEDLLDRDAAARAGVARLVDDAHPALAELANDLVLAVDDARLATVAASCTGSGGACASGRPRGSARRRHA